METLLPEEYHYTWNIYDIIKNNQINLSSGLGGNADQIGTKFFFLSLSRTGSFKLGYKKNQTSIGRIVFDGNKLNHDFKSIPVDYWGLKHTPRSYDSLDYNHDTGKYDTYVPIDSDKQLKGVHGLYFNVRRYGGYLLEDDFSVIWDLENKGGTVGQLINYLMNKYTVNKASEIIYGSGFDSYEKLHKFKLDKINENIRSV